ncbi:MAG: EAL domain-containing protein [Gammaproteobacteria bacterium]|nr:EAL domain-containing protein [Gammaproteobacteria bacterium]
MNKYTFKKILTSPLGQRLFLAILLFSSVITLLITIVQLHSDYKAELSVIEFQKEQIQNTSLQSLAQSVWVTDDVQGKKLLNGITQFSYVDYASVVSDGVTIWSAGAQNVRNEIVSKFALTYLHRGSEIEIAELKIVGSLDQVYWRLLEKFFFILSSNFLKTSLVAIFVLFLFYNLLGRHLIKMADFAETYGGSKNYQLFKLDREENKSLKEDELDMLTKSINQMIKSLKAKEDDLRVYLTVVEQGPNAVLMTDPKGRIEYINNQFSHISGYSFDEVKGQFVSMLSAGLTPKEQYDELWATITAGKIWQGDLQNKTKSGANYWENVRIAPIFDEQGKTKHYVSIKEDITLRKSYEAKLLYQANFDALTNLPNRVLVFDRISQAIVSHNRDSGNVAILFIDLDRFKNINDTLGHIAGDELLKQSAMRIKQCVRIGDTVARLGGDEFLIVLPSVRSEEKIENVAKKILDTFNSSFLIENHDVYVTASIGITIYPDDGLDPQRLLRNADSAMYRAKAEGRNNYCYFTQSMNDMARKRLELESLLRNALNNHELSLHFQPIVDARSKRIIGAEALLRWHNDVLGDVSPDTFIPLAEDIGLIVPIGEWVIRTACMTAASWQLEGHSIRIAINVSVRQFTKGNLIEVIDGVLDESKLPPELLEIEVTEGLLLEDSEEVQINLKKISNKGIRLSMDDFGTGYSSLSYLNKFSFNVLKIDRSFVSGIEKNPKDAELARVIISMAHGLNLEVIGEGVETVAQYDFLSSNKIDLIQGYLFSQPVPADQFLDLLNDAYDQSKHASFASLKEIET